MSSTIRRNPAIDFLKAVAVLGVIIIHSCSAGYFNPILSFDWFSAVFWGSVSRASVPIFFMCSGALLLPPEKKLSVKRLYTKNLLRILVAMFVWALAYKAYHLVVSGGYSSSDIFQSFKEVLLFKQEFHFYFIHILIIVYMFLPVTRLLAKYATAGELRYALGLWFLLGILYPTINDFWPFNLLTGIPVQWSLNMTYAAIGYGLLGYYLKIYPISLKRAIIFFISGFLWVWLGTVFMSVQMMTLYQHFWEGMTVGVVLLAVGIWGTVNHFKSVIKGKTALIVSKLSKASFCIYLVHVFWLYLFNGLGISVNDWPTLISIPLISLLNLALSYGSYRLLNQLPVVRKWLI